MPHVYEAIPEAKVPPGVRFDVPGRHQNQIIEIAYGGHHPDEHDAGDAYKRITDRSRPIGDPDRVTYYRLAAPMLAWALCDGVTENRATVREILADEAAAHGARQRIGRRSDLAVVGYPRAVEIGERIWVSNQAPQGMVRL